jgi:hypothetical protein
LPARPLRDSNLYIVTWRDQETHEALNRISTELTSQYSRDFGLIDAHQLCRCCLGQLSLADGPVDPNYQSSFDQVFAGVGQTEVSEYVACTGLLFEGFSLRHSSPHFSAVLAAAG